MRSLNQVVQITLINLRTLPQRLGTSLVVVVGIAGVVGVLVSVLAMSEGFRHTLASTGRARPRDHAARRLRRRAVERRGRATRPRCCATPARRRARRRRAPARLGRARGDGRPAAQGRDRPQQRARSAASQPAAFAIRDEVRIVEGRRFERGVREVIVGRKAARAVRRASASARASDSATATGRSSGIFASGGDVHESEIWADAEVAMSAFRRDGLPVGHGAARRRLGRRPRGAFKDSVSARPALLDQRAARARVLRQAGRRAVDPDQRARLHGGRLHGGRRDVRRAQLHVLGDRQPPGRDRHPAGHRLRRRCRWWSR